MFASLSRGSCATPVAASRVALGARARGGVGPSNLRSTVVLAAARGAGAGTARGRGGARSGSRGGSRGRGRGGAGGRDEGGGAADRRRSSGGGRGGRGGRAGGREDASSERERERRKRSTAERPAPPRAPPRAPLVFDDSSRASDVFPPEGDRDVSLQEMLAYERKGHVCIRGVLSQDEARPMVSDLIRETKARQLDAYRHRISVLCPGVDADAVASEAEALDILARSSEEEVGFLQTFNLHRPDARRARGEHGASSASSSADVPPCARYILSRRLAKVAAELLGAGEDERVRLYQSCVFVKPPGFGETHWHSDANMVPLDTNRFITLWLPLRPLHEDDAALVFAGGSHRDFSLPYWHSLEGMSDLSGRGYEVESYEPLDLGDLTAHAGWCLHWSPPQPEDCPPRYALSVCYFVDGAKRLVRSACRQEPHAEDAWSYEDWLDDIGEGEPARHPALPVVYP